MNAELAVARAFAETYPGEAAVLLEGLGSGEIVPFLDALPVASAAEVIRSMEGYAASRCLEEMSGAGAANLIGQLPLERAASLLRQLGKEARGPILAGVPETVSGPLSALLRYPEGTAGALMNPRVFTLPPDIDAEEALRRMRVYSGDALYYLYVVARDRRLIGVVNMRELMLDDPGERIEATMQREVMRLQAGTPLAAVLAHPGWLEYQALPVVDEQGLFVGALRHKSLRRLTSEGEERGADVRSTGAALGELFQIGLAGLAKGASGGLGGAEEE